MLLRFSYDTPNLMFEDSSCRLSVGGDSLGGAGTIRTLWFLPASRFLWNLDFGEGTEMKKGCGDNPAAPRSLVGERVEFCRSPFQLGACPPPTHDRSHT